GYRPQSSTESVGDRAQPPGANCAGGLRLGRKQPVHDPPRDVARPEGVRQRRSRLLEADCEVARLADAETARCLNCISADCLEMFLKRATKTNARPRAGRSIDHENQLADVLVECLLNLFLGNVAHDLFLHLAIFEDE